MPKILIFVLLSGGPPGPPPGPPPARAGRGGSRFNTRRSTGWEKLADMIVRSNAYSMLRALVVVILLLLLQSQCTQNPVLQYTLHREPQALCSRFTLNPKPCRSKKHEGSKENLNPKTLNPKPQIVKAPKALRLRVWGLDFG